MKSLATAAMFSYVLDSTPAQGVSEAHATISIVHAQLWSQFNAAVSRLSPYEQFIDLAATWKQETAFTSSIHDVILNPAYQEIIGLGKIALPWILDEMKHDPDYWFWALSSLTGANPVPSKDMGNFDAMTTAWLAWGQHRGYVD